MAHRIDTDVQPTAHTAVQAMIVRAQQAADQTGKAVGVRYDLTSDEISLVEISPDMPKEISFVRIAAPAGRVLAGPAGATDGAAGDQAGGQAPDVKASAIA